MVVQLCDLVHHHLHGGDVDHVVQLPSLYTPSVYIVTIKYSNFRMNGVSELKSFLTTHRLQLEAGGVPELYWCCLHTKLSKQVFDAGELFSLLQVRQRFSKVQ